MYWYLRVRCMDTGCNVCVVPMCYTCVMLQSLWQVLSVITINCDDYCKLLTKLSLQANYEKWLLPCLCPWWILQQPGHKLSYLPFQWPHLHHWILLSAALDQISEMKINKFKFVNKRNAQLSTSHGIYRYEYG